MAVTSYADLTYALWVLFFLVMRSAPVNPFKSVSCARAHTHTHTPKATRYALCHPICPKQHTSLLRPAPTKAAIMWVQPKMPWVLAPLFNSLLSNYRCLRTGEESGLIRSFLLTCSQNTHAHILTQTPTVGGQMHPKWSFLSNYNLPKNAENLLESCLEQNVAGLQGDWGLKGAVWQKFDGSINIKFRLESLCGCIMSGRQLLSCKIPPKTWNLTSSHLWRVSDNHVIYFQKVLHHEAIRKWETACRVHSMRGHPSSVWRHAEYLESCAHLSGSSVSRRPLFSPTDC